jgi:hypothetical protein
MACLIMTVIAKERLRMGVSKHNLTSSRIFAKEIYGMSLKRRSSYTYKHLQTLSFVEFERLDTLRKRVNTFKTSTEDLKNANKNIPLVSDFNTWVYHAGLCLHQNNREEAEKCFTNALQVIIGKTESPYRLARADCCLRWAAVYPFDHPKRQETVLLAQDAVFALEGIEEELCEDKSIISGLTLRREFLEKLHDLTPLKSTRMEIGRKILACNEELKRLNPQSRPFLLAS